MDKINEILNNKKYKYYLNKLYEYEKERKFCIHDIEHFLAVARIAYIKVLEEGLSYSKDVIYAIGLLHDIGRVLQYEDNTPHNEGSVIIGKEILDETSYNEKEKEEILRAINNHRKVEEDSLSKIIYISDKLSRNCFNCKALKECYWSIEKKNFKIKY
ncbi:MAG: HD domain-containing protein [Clostridiales bacterium]|nr:HD domain-containing protein [Clostridiales bacterium]